MCDVCRLEGLKSYFHNGNRRKMHRGKLYRVYVGRVARIKLCHLHSIQLFSVGEGRFLQGNLNFAQELSTNKSNYVD